MNFRPKGDRLLVEPDETIEHASSVGLVVAARDGKIVDSQKQFGRRGKVISAGPGKRTPKGNLLPMTVKVGDIVYYGEFVNTELELQGKVYNVISEADVTGIENATDEKQVA